MKKKGLALLLVLTVCAALLACGPFKDYDNDEAIMKNAGNFSMVMSAENEGIPGRYSLSCSTANGIKTLATLDLPETASFTVELTITKGRFKIVLCNSDYICGVVVDEDYDGVINVTVPEAGSYNLKIVAEEAGIDLSIDYSDYI